MKQYDDDHLKSIAQSVANALARQYNARGSKIRTPVELSFELELKEPKAAGQAITVIITNDSNNFVIKSQKIELNMAIYRDNVHEYLNTVIPHEMAHLDQKWKDFYSQSSSSAHGYVWQTSMRAMSQIPKATIALDFTKAVEAFKAHKAEQKKAKKKLPVSAV